MNEEPKPPVPCPVCPKCNEPTESIGDGLVTRCRACRIVAIPVPVGSTPAGLTMAEALRHAAQLVEVGGDIDDEQLSWAVLSTARDIAASFVAGIDALGEPPGAADAEDDDDDGLEMTSPGGRA